jgi:formylglycine-generating enzyme required for sulfatase activity
MNRHGPEDPVPPLGKNYLLAIGVDDYAHQAKLRNAVHDVEAVVRLLAERFHFEPEGGQQTIVLRNAEASNVRILTELRGLQQRIGPDDNLVIYFAGHGWYDEVTKRGYWIPPTAQFSKTEDHSGDYLSNQHVVDYIRSINSLHTVLIVDACFAGSLFRELREQQPSNQPASKRYAVRSRWALASGLNEPVEDGALGEHSPFARYLLAALAQPGHLLVSDVAQYVKKAVDMNARQRPTAGPLYATDDRGLGEFVFYPRAEDPEKVAWQAALAADTVVAYDDFVDDYPTSPHVPEARQRIRELEAQKKAAQEQNMFAAAQKSRSLADLNDYLDTYPHGRYAEQARELKRQIKEAQRQKEKEEAERRAKEAEKLRLEKLAEEERKKGEEEARQKREAEKRKAEEEAVKLFLAQLAEEKRKKEEEETQQKEEAERRVQEEEEQQRQAEEQRRKEEAEKRKAEEAQRQKEKEEETAWQTATALGTLEAYQTYLNQYSKGAKATQAQAMVAKLRSKPGIQSPYLKPAIGIGSLLLVVYGLFQILSMIERTQGAGTDSTLTAPADTTRNQTYTETVNGVSFTMIYVQGGTFQMGDTFGEGEGDEKPVHPVTLDGYHLGQTEVTQALWREVMGTDPSYFKNCDQCPVENVSWEDAQSFIQKLNQRTGKKYGLPTEAQWEFAARELGRKVRFGNGKDILKPNEANFYASKDYKQPYSEVGEYRGKTIPVKTFAPNAQGLYDMSGNVWEWCQDWYGTYPSSPARNPQGPSTGTSRVFRGGSWLNDPQYARAASRNYGAPAHRGGLVGFRLVSL